MTGSADWILETSSSVGVGAIVLDGASDGWARFQDAFADNDPVYYAVINGVNKESGIGTFDGSNVLQRTTITATLVNGVYNNIDPIAISLVGESTVGCILTGATQLSNDDKYTQDEINSLLTGKITSVIAGDNVTVDSSDNENPVVSVSDALFDGKQNILPPVTNNNTFLSSLENGTQSWQLPVTKHSDQTDYVVDDVVVESGTLYTCIITHSAQPFNFSNWSPTVNAVGSGQTFNYEWTSGTSGDPGDGNVGVNNSDAALATQIRVSKLTVNDNDVSVFIEEWVSGEYIGVDELGGDQESAYYLLTSGPTDEGTYYSFTGTYVGGSGDPDNNAEVVISHLTDPNNKLPAGGTIGQLLTKTSSANYDTDWTDPPAGGLDDKLNHTNGVATGIYEHIVNRGSVSTVTVNVAGGNVYEAIADGDTEIVTSGWTADSSGALLELTTLGTEILTWTGITWDTGVPPVNNSAGVIRAILSSLDGGTTVNGSIARENT